MSSRVLRKLGLQGEKDLNSLGNDESDTEADFSSSSSSKKKQLNINRYDLLNQQSHSESEVKEDDNETAGSLNAHDGAIDLRDASRRKKKKKKKKSCKVPSSNTRSSEDNIEDEVERSVREVNEILGEMEENEAPNVAESSSSVAKLNFLSIDSRALNPNNELRRIFGSKIVQNDQTKKRGRNRGHLRSTILVTPKENWLNIGKPGISMKLVENKNGIQYFTYEHSLNYQQIQMKFLEAVESLHPDYIVNIINSHPYHVDALLQLSDLCKLSDDLSMAAEFIQRALYCLECAFHPSFLIASGKCRLDYRRQENRALYISLFKHMLSIGSRACYRTALEFSKLILSLDPEGDPLAIILAMDFYALRAQEYDWLLKMFNECEPTRNLSQLPNFAYSIAVAYFQRGDVEAAHAQLQKALIQFPGVLLALTEKCSVQVDSRIMSSSFFTNASAKQSKSLSQLEILYVARSYHVWKESELLPWLENNVHRVLDRVESGDPLVEEWERNRQTRYPATPRNILRHILLLDMKDVPILMNEDLPTPYFNFDPLPPLDSINLYSRPTRTTNVSENSTLVSFLRSLMPNYNMNQVASDEAGDEPAEGGAYEGHVVDFRRSVASLLDAMRDLVSNIHLPDVPGDGDAEDDPDSDEDHPWEFVYSNFREKSRSSTFVAAKSGKMLTAPSTPTLSSELKALIQQRNVLTSRSKSKVLDALDHQIIQDKFSRQAELKAKRIEEIFTSEVSYLNQLEVAMKFFRTPVLESNLKMPDGLKTLLDDLESLYKVNGELLNELRNHGEDVAKAFITVAPFFKLYSVYAYDYRQGIAVLQEIPKTNPKLDALIKRQETRPEVGTKLGSLLIAPIQRVPRYRLLLKELISYTSPSSPEYENILEAIRLVETATEHINSLVSEQENMQRIIELQKSLCGGRPTLVYPGRKLIKEGILMKVSKKCKKPQPRYFVLMSDVLMYCKMTGVPLGEPNSLRCSCVLPLRKCSVKQVLSDKVFNVSCLPLSLNLYSDEPYTSDSWIAALNQAIDQEEQGRQTLLRRGSSRHPMRKKELNTMTETLTPRKRKQQQEDIDDICLPFHSPWKRNKITANSALFQISSEQMIQQQPRRAGYLSSIKKAISNFGQSIQKYWVPIYTGRDTAADRRITN